MRSNICIAQVQLAVLLALQIFAHHKVLAEGESCSNAGVSNSAPGICVGIKSCQPYLQTLQQQGAAASGFLRNTVCYFDGNNPVVCCPRSLNPSPTLPTTRPVIAPPTRSNNTFGPLYAPDCGYSSASHNRVVGGVPAELGAWPWIAALGYRTKKSDPIGWLCGGSLISRQHILTAAHCVYNHQDLSVARLGDHNINDDFDGANPIDVRIKRGIIHPGYSAVNHVNDIAILRLAHQVTFTPAVHPICLPFPPEVRDRNYVGNFPFVAGWGALYFKGPASTILQEVQLPVVSNEACAKAFRPFPKQVIDKRVMCAGYTVGGKDACQGDSGGPLMFPKGYTYYAIGIVSFGFRCAEPGFPGVYTRVTHFLDFILKNMN